MNRRILKKKSKQAYDFAKKYNILPFKGGYFRSSTPRYGTSHHGLILECCRRKEKGGKYCCCDCLKGTWMYGATEGYYEPEWEETTVYSQIRDLILWTQKKPEGCSDKEYRRLCRILSIEQKHIDAQNKWVDSLYIKSHA